MIKGKIAICPRLLRMLIVDLPGGAPKITGNN